MSVLETFLLLFETNSADVKKGTQEAKGAVDNLQNSLNRTDVVTKKVGESFMGLTRSAVGFIGAAIGAGAIIRSVFQTSQFTAMLNDASETLGISVESISQWGGAVKENGGSTEGFIGTLKSLSVAMTQIDVTGKSKLKPFFDSLGVSMLDAKGNTRPVIDLLLDVSDAFEKLDKQDSAALGRRMGLDEGTILLLQKGRREVESLLKVYKDLGEVKKEDAEAADKFNDQLDRLSYAMTIAAAKAGTLILPALTKFLEVLEGLYKWVRANGVTIQAFFIAIAAAITASMIPALLAAIAPFAKLLALMFGIAGAKGALAVLTAGFWSMVAPLAAITFYFLAFEDFINYLKGNKSIFGEIQSYLENLSGFKWIADVISNTKGWVNNSGENYGMMSGSYMPSNSTRAEFLKSTGATRNVSIGEVTINTQATDAKGIATDMTGALSHTLNGYDDGVER